jgi:hypothetical protein
MVSPTVDLKEHQLLTALVYNHSKSFTVFAGAS